MLAEGTTTSCDGVRFVLQAKTEQSSTPSPMEEDTTEDKFSFFTEVWPDIPVPPPGQRFRNGGPRSLMLERAAPAPGRDGSYCWVHHKPSNLMDIVTVPWHLAELPVPRAFVCVFRSFSVVCVHFNGSRLDVEISHESRNFIGVAYECWYDNNQKIRVSSQCRVRVFLLESLLRAYRISICKCSTALEVISSRQIMSTPKGKYRDHRPPEHTKSRFCIVRKKSTQIIWSLEFSELM